MKNKTDKNLIEINNSRKTSASGDVGVVVLDNTVVALHLFHFITSHTVIYFQSSTMTAKICSKIFGSPLHCTTDTDNSLLNIFIFTTITAA